jgi:polyhydroxyalkanoate synthesis regulator phasin
MEIRNLNEKDIEAFKKTFDEVSKENPHATMRIFKQKMEQMEKDANKKNLVALEEDIKDLKRQIAELSIELEGLKYHIWKG